MTIQHTKKITLPDNCEVKSRHFITRTSHDFNLDSATKTWPAPWNVTGLLFDFDSKILAAHVASLKLINYSSMPVMDLQLLMQGTQHYPHFWLTTTSALQQQS